MNAKPILQAAQVLAKKEALEEIKSAIRQHVGEDATSIWEALIDIAEGKTWQPILPNGKMLASVIMPTTVERLRAAEILLEQLHRRTRKNRAIESVRQLPDDELERRVASLTAAEPSDEEEDP